MFDLRYEKSPRMTKAPSPMFIIKIPAWEVREPKKLLQFLDIFESRGLVLSLAPVVRTDTQHVKMVRVAR